jgi:hypothetical protein
MLQTVTLFYIHCASKSMRNFHYLLLKEMLWHYVVVTNLSTCVCWLVVRTAFKCSSTEDYNCSSDLVQFHYRVFSPGIRGAALQQMTRGRATIHRWKGGRYILSAKRTLLASIKCRYHPPLEELRKWHQQLLLGSNSAKVDCLGERLRVCLYIDKAHHAEGLVTQKCSQKNP